MVHELQDDEVTLWKSANISLDNDRYMIVMYYYHTVKGDRAKSFYKCNIRIETRENWEKMRNDLLLENPGEALRTSMIGLDDDYRIYYSRKIFNKADMSKWIGTKFSPVKTTTMERFVTEELSENVVEPFLRKYQVNGNEIDITDIQNIPEGQWFSAFKEKKTGKRRKPRVIMWYHRV